MSIVTNRQIQESDKLLAALARRTGELSFARARKDAEAAYRQTRPKTRHRLARHFRKGCNPAKLDEFLGGCEGRGSPILVKHTVIS